MEKSRKQWINDCTDSRIYKMMNRKYIMNNYCTICPPNKGCNTSRWGFDNNWKKHRKTQYRNK